MDYKNGKIYKLVSDQTDMFYIGSTASTLTKRLHGHRRQYYEWKHNGRRFTSSFYLFELGGSVEVILVEGFPCNNKDELRSRERFYFDKFREQIVNKSKPFVVGECVDRKEYMKKYYSLEREAVLQKCKEYRNNHKVEIQERDKQYYERNMGRIKENVKEYARKNRSVILEKKKEYAEKNKETISTKRSETILCDRCGSSLTVQHLKRHQETKKCKKLSSNPEIPILSTTL